MTGVGENLQPLNLPKMPSVMVNPCVPVATKDVFRALGLRNGELLVGATDVLLQDRSWPEPDASVTEWIEAFVEVGNDLEAPALRIQPVIDEVLSALRDAKGAKLARMSGSGATCFAIFADDADAQAAAEKIRRDHPVWWVHAGTLS
jgi:4-diphosphocytidyl-2-C-methyl-D-erythritol kinase